MHLGLHILGVALLICNAVLKLPYSVEESSTALDTVLWPWSCKVKCSDEHLVGTKCICTVYIYDVVRIYNVASWLTHLLAVLTEDHTMWCSLLVWLWCRNYALIVQELVPESWIQKVKCCMLHSSIVPVNRKPVLECLLACKSLCVVRICISEEIPW